jgi:hypothetical protein
MTQLQQALAEVQKLPDEEQDAIAAMILEELADEQRWADSFARSHDKLAAWAERVRDEIRTGRVHGVRFEEL